MRRKGKSFSGTVTPLFASMLVPQVVEGEGSGQPSEPNDHLQLLLPLRKNKFLLLQHLSYKRPKHLGKPKEGIGTCGSPRCQEAMGGTIAQTRSERVPTPSYDSPLLGGNTPGSDEERLEQHELMNNVPPTPHDSPLSGGDTPGSDEGRPNINELMAICTNLSNRVLALETSKTAQDLVINKLKNKVKRLEKKLRARTPGIKLFKIGTSRRKSLDKEIVSK
ncbi:hypothetical protein Tco_1436910 [Tanacetum coccineum]